MCLINSEGRIHGYCFKCSVMDPHGKVQKTVSLCFLFLLFYHTHIHIQDSMSLIPYNKYLAACEEYWEENGDQMINVV